MLTSRKAGKGARKEKRRPSRTRNRIRHGLGFALSFAVLIAVFVGGDRVAADAQGTGGGMQQLLQNLPPSLQQSLQGAMQGSTNQSQAQAPTAQPVILSPAQSVQGQPPSQLEMIMSSRIGQEIDQFGYNQIGVGQNVMVPQTGAVQDSYVLGPGDVINISLRGQENEDYTETVDRNGQVTLPKLSPLAAAGRTLGEFQRELAGAISRAYVSTQAFATVNQLRQVSVLVAGNVANPGVRILTASSTPLDALLLSGGISKTGSLRNIKLVRDNRIITIDLYGVLTEQQSRAALLNLRDGDRILVPPLGATVAIAGVQRPAIYELPPGRKSITLKQLIELGAGYTLPGAYTSSVLRLMPDGTRRFVDVSNEPKATIGEGEIVVVKPSVDISLNRVNLVGAVRTPGAYALGKYPTLHDLLPSSQSLLPGAYVLFGFIERTDPKTLQHEAIPFSPLHVTEGKENADLVSDDTVHVLTEAGMRCLLQVVAAAVPAPGTLQPPQIAPIISGYPPPVNKNGGGTNPPGQGAPSVLSPLSFQINGGTNTYTQTAIINPNTTCGQPTQTAQVTLPTNAGSTGQPQMSGSVNPQTPGGLQSQATNNTLGAYLSALNPVPTTVGASTPTMLSQTPAFPQANTTQGNLAGQVPNLTTSLQAAPSQSSISPTLPYPGANLPGATAPPYASSTSPYANSNSQVGAVASSVPGQATGPIDLGGFTSDQALFLANALSEYQITISGAVQQPGVLMVAPNTTLAEAVAGAHGFVVDTDLSSVEVTSVDIDNARGMAHTSRKRYRADAGDLAMIVLQPLDTVMFHHVFADIASSTVTIIGEVHYPGVYNVMRGEHLSTLLKRAGGLTDDAYPYGTVFLRPSVALLEQKAFTREAQDIRSQMFNALLRPTRATATQAPPSLEAVTALNNMLGQVEARPALGRVSYIADPAALRAHPERDPILEDGDHIYIPTRPSSVSVLGEVMQPGTIPYDPALTAHDYIMKAGGSSQFAEESGTIIILPDGSARYPNDGSWLSFGDDRIPPGSVIMVPRDLTSLRLDDLLVASTQVFAQLATTAAALAVLSNHP